jgi:hypothetical protein
MSTIKMKIVGYDEASNSVLVSYASTETQSQDPADYPAVAIQVNAADDLDKIKRDIATMGMQIVRSQINQERMASNQSKVNEIKELVGQEFSFAESDLDAGTGAFENEVVL